MHSGDITLRLSVVFLVAGIIALLTSLYEVDRREKSSSATHAANLAEIDQQLQILTNQIRVLNDQYTSQLSTNERQLQVLNAQIQAVTRQYDARLKKLEDDLRVLRSEWAPFRR